MITSLLLFFYKHIIRLILVINVYQLKYVESNARFKYFLTMEVLSLTTDLCIVIHEKDQFATS